LADLRSTASVPKTPCGLAAAVPTRVAAMLNYAV